MTLIPTWDDRLHLFPLFASVLFVSFNISPWRPGPVCWFMLRRHWRCSERTVFFRCSILFLLSVSCSYWADSASAPHGDQVKFGLKGHVWAAALRPRKITASPITSKTRCLVLTLVQNPCHHGDEFSKRSARPEREDHWAVRDNR